MKRTPLRRKTALKRSSSIRKAKPATKAKQAAQRKAVKERAGEDHYGLVALYPRCEFEHRCLMDARTWHRCNARGIEMAHIISRVNCGTARDLPEVVVWACRWHHDIYDGRKIEAAWRKPRVPRALLARCRRAIKAAAMKAPLKRSIRERLT